MNAIVERAKAKLRDACEAFEDEMAAITDDWTVGAIGSGERYRRIIRAAAFSEAAFAAYDETLRWEGIASP